MISERLTKEPIAVLSLIVTLVVGAVTSPLIVEWYGGPNLIGDIHFRQVDDGRCLPAKVAIANSGRSAAQNVQIHYELDFFSKRGDITGYFSGNEPIARVVQKVDYIDKATYILIPLLPPKVEQDFVFIEQQNEPDAFERRVKLLLQRDPRVFNLPRVTLITSDRGTAELRRHDPQCTVRR